MKLQTKTYRVKGEWIYTWWYKLVSTRQNGEEAEEEQGHLNIKGSDFGKETEHNRIPQVRIPQCNVDRGTWSAMVKALPQKLWGVLMKAY